MSCKCPPEKWECVYTCMAIWYAKQTVKKGGAGIMVVEDDTSNEALALLDALAEAVNDQQIDFDLFTTTAEKLYGIRQLNAAFTLT